MSKQYIIDGNPDDIRREITSAVLEGREIRLTVHAIGIEAVRAAFFKPYALLLKTGANEMMAAIAIANGPFNVPDDEISGPGTLKIFTALPPTATVYDRDEIIY